jgi:hypothetical protein
MTDRTDEALVTASTLVSFLVTVVLLLRLHPAWTLQLAVVTYGLLLLDTLLVPLLRNSVLWLLPVHGMAVLIGVYGALLLVDHQHLWVYLAGLLLFVLFAFLHMAYFDRRWHHHARSSDQHTSTTESTED